MLRYNLIAGMENITLDSTLEKLLSAYPEASGVAFYSMEFSIFKHVGANKDILEKYKDIPMMSLDEEFQTTFNYIITGDGSIITFFIEGVHFVSVYTENTQPNKQLAQRMYQQFLPELQSIIYQIHETEGVF